MAVGAQLRTVRANGLTFSIREWGMAGMPTMVLVPGTGLAAAIFAETEALLAAEWHGFTVDRRGHGLSEKPATGYDWTNFGDDLAAIAVALDLNDATAIGHSAGGTDVLLAATQTPGRWAALGVMEPTVQDPRRPPGPETDPPSWQEVTERQRRRRSSFPTIEFALERYMTNPGFARCPVERVRTYLEHALEPAEDGSWALRCPPSAEMLMTIPIRQAMTHCYLPPEGRTDPFVALPDLRLPVHVYATEHSGGFYRAMAEIAASLIPDSAFHDLPGLGHIVPLESPETVAGIARTLRAAR